MRSTDWIYALAGAFVDPAWEGASSSAWGFLDDTATLYARGDIDRATARARVLEVSAHVGVRRDSRGRRIGRNPWRDMVTDVHRSAMAAWEAAREAATSLYPAEVAEWESTHPAPQFLDTLTHLSRKA